MAAYGKKQQVRRRRMMQFHHEWARRKWESAFSEDWDYEYLLGHLKAKLETMERYNMHLSHIVNGPYYGHQIHRAIQMIDIILERCEPSSSKHYVNMRNRNRIPRPADGGALFWSEAQKLRFDKAWMLLWKILSEQMMSWGD